MAIFTGNYQSDVFVPPTEKQIDTRCRSWFYVRTLSIKLHHTWTQNWDVLKTTRLHLSVNRSDYRTFTCRKWAISQSLIIHPKLWSNYTLALLHRLCPKISSSQHSVVKPLFPSENNQSRSENTIQNYQ